MSRERLLPDESHQITIEPTRRRVRVRVGETTVAVSDDALTLAETGYPPVHYLPRRDVDPELLLETRTETWCPYKGDASYFSLVTTERTLEDAVWSYAEPHDAVAPIRGHLAFDAGRVEVVLG